MQSTSEDLCAAPEAVCDASTHALAVVTAPPRFWELSRLTGWVANLVVFRSVCFLGDYNLEHELLQT